MAGKRKMKAKLISSIFLLLLAATIASASTEINLKTLINDKIDIQILDPSQVYLLVDSFHLNSGSLGELNVTYTGGLPQIDIKVQVNENGQAVMVEKFKDIDTDKPIYLIVVPGNVSIYEKTATPVVVENQTNITANITANTTILSNTDNSTGKGIFTGLVTSTGKVFTSSITYYLIGGIVLVLVAGFVAIKLFGNRAPSPSFNPKPNYPVNRNSMNQISSIKEAINKPENKDLMDSENRARQLQTEINKLRNKQVIDDKETKIQKDIAEFERRLAEEKKELERLRRGW